MKLYQKLIAVLFVVFTLPQFSIAQDQLTGQLAYNIHRELPYILINEAQLSVAETIMDLDPRYKPSWVREYISVEISASHNGQIKTVAGENAMLTPAQKELMNQADAATPIYVKIDYIPENTLKDNEPKVADFTFTVDPDNEAQYTGGRQKMQQYLKTKVIDQIPDSVFTGYALAAVKFTVNEAGEIIDAHVVETSKDEQVDALLLETIRKMPCWAPAEYANGLKVKQAFVLTVGNMQNCIVNTLNIRQ